VGYLLKRSAGVKWIAEFRDPWYPPPGRIRRWIERRILTRFLKAADGVVLISEGLRDEFAREFSVPRAKLYVVSNGYDEAEYDAIPQCAVFPRERVNFSHFGTVYGGFAGRFFEAVEQLIASDPAIAERLQVNIVGFPDDTARAAASSPRLAGVVKLWPFMEQSSAIQAMQSSDILLLFLGNPETSRLSGLGKIYWYLRVGKPVLALAYDGDCKSLILRSKAGAVIQADSAQEIARAIRDLLSEDSRRRIQPLPEVVAEFRYDRLASRLADVLREVSSR
jgi:glycosyltransferase involved in cell wall biosynthesis